MGFVLVLSSGVANNFEWGGDAEGIKRDRVWAGGRGLGLPRKFLQFHP